MKSSHLFGQPAITGKYLLLNLFLFSSLFFSCTGTKDLSVVNLSSLYNDNDRIYDPEFSINHQSDSISRLSVLISNKAFLFIRQSDDHFSASFTLRYKLAESYENINMVLDSGSTNYRIPEENKNLRSVYELNFHMPKKSEMLLVVTIEDNQKHFSETSYVSVDNTAPDCRQSFTIQVKNEKHISFKNYFCDHDSMRILFRDTNVHQLFVRAYDRHFPLAPPPFSFDTRDDFDYRPDFTFTYKASDTGFITLPQRGFYHFQTDSFGKNGITVFIYSRSFPSVTSPEQMLECIRYLTTKREFEEMKNNADKKAAMDKFWLDLGGNTERTKLLIRKYYTRIREANQYFSSYTEGWRTDRGMVYTIFGKPNSVYKSSTAESWIYGTPNNALSLNFFFTKVINPFTDNDFMLSREPLFEGSWMRAVDVWRQGRVYNDN